MSDEDRTYEFLDPEVEDAKQFAALTEAGKRVEAQLIEVENTLDQLPQQRDELAKALKDIKERRAKLDVPSEEQLAAARAQLGIAAGPAPGGPPPGGPFPPAP